MRDNYVCVCLTYLYVLVLIGVLEVGIRYGARGPRDTRLAVSCEVRPLLSDRDVAHEHTTPRPSAD